MKLALKGGGCENVARNTRCPTTASTRIATSTVVARRSSTRCCRRRGKGCGPGILGVCIGGDRATGYELSKTQFLRRLDDRNTEPKLDALEQDISKPRTISASARWVSAANHVARRENLHGQPRAGVVFRQHQLYVLGLPPSGRDAGCER